MADSDLWYPSEDSLWTEPLPAFRWGYTDGWYANEIRSDHAESQRLQETNPDMDPLKRMMQTTYPYDGFEVQLRRAKFTGSRWALRLEIRPTMSGHEPVIFPTDSQRERMDSWAALELN